MISKSSLFCKILDIDIFLAIQRSEAFGFKPHYRAPSTDHSESLKRCIVLVMAPTHIDIYVYVYIYIYIHTCMYLPPCRSTPLSSIATCGTCGPFLRGCGLLKHQGLVVWGQRAREGGGWRVGFKKPRVCCAAVSRFELDMVSMLSAGAATALMPGFLKFLSTLCVKQTF